MRHSKQKDALLGLIESKELYHPTADEVYSRLRLDNPKISLGTVYRNLNKMCENGTIFKVDSIDGQSRYDCNTQEHLHAVCTECKAIIDIDIKLFDKLKKKAELNGFYATDGQTILYGKCEKCVKKNSNIKKGK